MYCVLAAMVMSAVFAYAPLLKNLSGGMRIIIVTVAVAAFFAKMFPVEEEDAS
jgi:hydrogenase-4 membrane subunit HyfE